MKSLILLATLILSTHAYSAEDKCYNEAKTAAFNYAKNDEITLNEAEFGELFGDEHVEVSKENRVQYERWSFGNTSSFIITELKLVKNKCHVLEVYQAQNDQDWD